jgi:predicted enzyme related to lactoylglutathione lyase
MPTIDAHDPGTLAWADLMSSDLPAVTRFYTGLFGWQTNDVEMPGGGSYRMFQRDGRDVAAVSQQQSGAGEGMGPADVWTVWFAGQADAAAERATAAGGSVIMPPSDVGPAGRLTVLADPGGAAFGIWQAGEHHGAGLMGEPGALAWCEVNTRAYDACLDFYPKLFGWAAEDLPMEGARYTVWKRHDQTVAGMLEMNEQWVGVPPHWMLYFAVDDTDQAAKRASELSGGVGAPPFDTPYGRIAVLSDPAGAHFSVIRLTTGS